MLAELGEVMNGTRAGRTMPEQVTLFESQGMAIQDLVIAAELARLRAGEGPRHRGGRGGVAEAVGVDGRVDTAHADTV